MGQKIIIIVKTLENFKEKSFFFHVKIELFIYYCQNTTIRLVSNNNDSFFFYEKIDYLQYLVNV